jgi:hypothetical protein
LFWLARRNQEIQIMHRLFTTPETTTDFCPRDRRMSAQSVEKIESQSIDLINPELRGVLSPEGDTFQNFHHRDP